jgi:predicted secreted Zn-dependent protease
VSFQFVPTVRSLRDVDGSTLTDVAATIAQDDESAKTEWFPRYSVETTGDTVSSAAIIVETRITMPRWRGYTTASQPERQEWDRFWLALEAHELGHIELAKSHLCMVDGQLMGASLDSASQIWSAAVDALNAASDAYDLETDHGRTQGTVIDISGAAPATV